MLEVTSKTTLATTARTLATSFELVQHHSTTFAPAHWQNEELAQEPLPPDQKIWLPMSRRDKQRLGNHAGILFSNDSEITNFDLMLRQFAIEHEEDVTSLLIRTRSGLKALTETGELVEPDGSFHPNVLGPVLNTDEDDKAEVFEVVEGWLNSEEEAHSLLTHLATALCPGWSAVKYVLLIGDGRNGKSVLLNMVSDVFGAGNISSVTRQQMADRLPVVAELNNKLLNIIFDGEMAYIKDSSVEKTLIAGEPAVVRMLYENGNTTVRTNALFIEALNSEPKTRDKSGALQKRLSRYWFPNVYQMDYAFERKMRSPRMLGAFLALLLDHFVKQDELAEKLKQTSGSLALQIEQNLLNSPVHQFASHLVHTDPKYIDKLMDGPLDMDALIQSFMAWRIAEGHNEFSTEDTRKMFREAFYTEWKSARENGRVIKKQKIKGAKPDIQALLQQLKGAEDEDTEAAVVED